MSTLHYDDKGHPAAAPIESAEDQTNEKKLDVYETNVQIKLAEDEIIDPAEYSDEEYKKILRKVDFILLPLMWWCYGIQQTDKTGLGTMNLYGLQKDTGMVGNQYSLLTVVFYVAYAIFEFPSNVVLQRFNMGKCLTVYMFCWGVIVLAQAFLNSWAPFMALRFLQGAFECTISPGFNLIIANWYTTREHSSRSLVFQSANAGWGVVVDLTMYGIAQNANKHPGGFAAWRGISAFLGGQTLLAAAIAWFMLGTPNEVRWLSAREKSVANARILSNNAGTDLTGKKEWKWSQVREAFLDPVLYFQFVNAFLNCVINGSLTTFGTVVNRSFGFTESEVILYGIPRNVVSVLYFAAVGYTSLRFVNIRMYWMMVSAVFPFIGLLVIALLPSDERFRWVKWGMYMMTVTFVICLFSAWALISSNTAGRTKRSVISSMTFIAYCTGNIAGSQIMKAKDAPRYIPGTIVMAVCMAVEVATIFSWRCWLVYQNKKKDAEIAQMGLTAEEIERRGQEMGANDITDMKNPFFKYAM